jgi:hypothetical protein
LQKSEFRSASRSRFRSRSRSRFRSRIPVPCFHPLLCCFAASLLCCFAALLLCCFATVHPKAGDTEAWKGWDGAASDPGSSPAARPLVRV